MNKKEKVISGLTEKQKSKAIGHFNEIYECGSLDEREYRIIYLAWLLANGYVYTDPHNGMVTFDEKEAGVRLTDYEIDIEDDNSGGVNIELTCNFYDVEGLAEKMHFMKSK